jgi:hypothetical protein
MVSSVLAVSRPSRRLQWTAEKQRRKNVKFSRKKIFVISKFKIHHGFVRSNACSLSSPRTTGSTSATKLNKLSCVFPYTTELTASVYGTYFTVNQLVLPVRYSSYRVSCTITNQYGIVRSHFREESSETDRTVRVGHCNYNTESSYE